MGTFVLRQTVNPRTYSGDWEASGVADYDAILSTHSDNRFASVRIPLGTTGLYLDGSGTPTEFDDLPDDFGIQELTYLSFPTLPAGDFINLPVSNSMAQVLTTAQFHWFLDVTGIYQSTVLGSEKLTFSDPYTLAGGYPFVPTKWNGYLAALIAQSTLVISFYSAGLGSGCRFPNIDFANFGIAGVYASYPEPANPTIGGLGGIDLGGAATIQALTDASGIYTLVPSQYHDELYQRVGTTSTTTTVAIPEPFFKTGFIGNR